MIEEIRIRVGQKVEVITSEGHYFIDKVISSFHIKKLLCRLTCYSLYAYEEELKQGFFTIEGGHRIGVVGHVSKKMDTLSDISGLNIRIAHECIDCAKEILPFLRDKANIYNALFVSSPGGGKTTYLRDSIRILSNEGIKVGVVDERSEIGATFHGSLQNDLGCCTDVLDNCSKIDGMRMLLRSMSPRVIAIDEIGGENEAMVLQEMIYAGVAILGTIHATSISEVLHKPGIGKMVESKAFQRIILLEKRNGKRSYQIYDTETYRILFDNYKYSGNSDTEEKTMENEASMESRYHKDLLSIVCNL